MANYLVTGGAGFIGSNIVRFLVNRGLDKVRVIDDLSSGRMINLNTLMDKIEFIQGDIRNIKTLKKAVDGIDYILHLAAIPSVPRSVLLPDLTNDVNINGTLNLLIAARDAKVKRVVFTSSSSIYGDSPVMPKVETMIPNPISPYGIHKLTGEYYSKVFFQLYGLETISLRYFNVFGPNQDPASEYAAVIPKFIKMILNDQNPTIFGDGEQTRDFTYVINVVKANILAAESKLDGYFGEVVNIACNDSISLNSLVDMINEILGKNVKPTYLPVRAGDIKHSLAGIQKAKEILNFSPEIMMKEGLQLTVNWYKNQNG